MPKPIVHGHGGSLVEAVKGNALALDLGEDDRFLWFTTTGWVMWNAQITALLVGSTICIYDGNPGYPDMSRLWRFAEDMQLTFMGVGAAFYANCMKAAIEPAKIADLSRLRSLGSTGSPLAGACRPYAGVDQWRHRRGGFICRCVSCATYLCR
jgi:acetoacetyl-CoA synthetase